MKKLVLIVAGLFCMATMGYSQVDDRAVIPVAVTLNSILRLNVVSGGNIDFTFNTLQDYSAGITNSDAYDTKFTVASSVDWQVDIYAEDNALVGTDDESGLNVLDLNNVGYRVSNAGNAADTDFNIPSLNSTAALSQAEVILVGKTGTTSNAGDVNKNAFIINWRCGTKEEGMRPESILEQSVAADRYATNVFLILKAL